MAERDHQVNASMTSDAATLAPLAGVRVLDFTHHIAGPRCTKLLADFGAEVIKIERPPAGDPARRLGPFPDDVPGLERSGSFLFLNTNKRSVTINLKSVRGQALALALVERADVVVENFRPGVIASMGLDFATLSARRPGLVMTSISNFGQTGPYRDLPASELTLYAMGGPMNATGHRNYEPLKLAANVVQHHAGSVAAFATLLAMNAEEERREAGETPRGELIDVSIYETQAGFRDRRVIYLSAFAYTGVTTQRPLPGTRPAMGVRPAADGYVNQHPSRLERYRGLMRLIGRDDLAERIPEGSPLLSAIEPEMAEEMETSYLLWLLKHEKRNAVALLQGAQLLSAPVNTVQDLFDDPVYAARGVFETIDHPATGPVRYPGRPFIMGESPRPPARRAPLLGEHNVDILCDELGLPREDLARLGEQGVV